MIKAIFFDFFGTLVENGVFPSPIKQVEYILYIKEDFHEYVKKFENAFMTREYENLTDGFTEVCKVFNVLPDERKIDLLIGMWNKNNLLAKPYPEAIEVLESLKDDYKLILIADCDKSFQQILDKFELRKYFSEMVLSYENGLLKSNPEMFKIALKKLKLKPEECLMVGDSIESDIRGAEGAGIKAVLIDRRGRREYENKIFDLKEINQFL